MKKLIFTIFSIFLFSLSYSSIGDSSRVDSCQINGIDISRYQKKLDWDKVSVDFIFIKATEGSSLVDRYFKTNWDSAQSRNIVKGAYHFYRPYISPYVQFNNFKKYVKLNPGDLPPVLDVEVIPSDRKKRVLFFKDVKKWLVLAEKQYGQKPIIYASLSVWKHYLNTPQFEEYFIWVAYYNDQTTDVSTHLEKWHFWQYSPTVTMNGIPALVDHNFFNGTMEDLNGLCIKPNCPQK
jgi:lysozyme